MVVMTRMQNLDGPRMQNLDEANLSIRKNGCRKLDDVTYCAVMTSATAENLTMLRLPNENWLHKT